MDLRRHDAGHSRVMPSLLSHVSLSCSAPSDAQPTGRDAKASRASGPTIRTPPVACSSRRRGRARRLATFRCPDAGVRDGPSGPPAARPRPRGESLDADTGSVGGRSRRSCSVLPRSVPSVGSSAHRSRRNSTFSSKPFRRASLSLSTTSAPTPGANGCWVLRAT